VPKRSSVASHVTESNFVAPMLSDPETGHQQTVGLSATDCSRLWQTTADYCSACSAVVPVEKVYPFEKKKKDTFPFEFYHTNKNR
jgi:hypothetical protein